MKSQIVLAAVSCGAIASMAEIPTPEPVETRPPAAATMPHCSTHLVYSERVRALVRVDCAGKSVELSWRRSASTPFLEDAASDLQSQRTTTYWPTAAEVIGPNMILVAGKEPDTGNTLIERWTLRAPSFDDPATSPRLELMASVELLYSARIEGRHVVRTMLAVRGKPSSVFVHFHDSRGLYEFDWSAPRKAMSLVLSAKSEPKLSIDGWNATQVGDHKTHGYVYVLAGVDCVPTVESLVLIDSNRDGVIDSHGMSLERFHELGLARGDEYRELNGVCRD